MPLGFMPPGRRWYLSVVFVFRMCSVIVLHPINKLTGHRSQKPQFLHVQYRDATSRNLLPRSLEPHYSTRYRVLGFAHMITKNVKSNYVKISDIVKMSLTQPQENIFQKRFFLAVTEFIDVVHGL